MRYFAVQATGNLLLGWLAWVWLGIDDRTGAQLAATAALGVVIILAVLLLHASAFVVASGERNLTMAFRRAFNRLHWFALWATVAGLAASAALRLPGVWGACLAGLAIALLVPVAAALVTGEKGSLRGVGAVYRSRHYWLRAPLAGLAIVLMPMLLVNWVPAATSLRAQFASATVRLLAAYLFALVDWLSLVAAGTLRRNAGRPEASHATTAGLP